MTGKQGNASLKDVVREASSSPSVDYRLKFTSCQPPLAMHVPDSKKQ